MRGIIKTTKKGFARIVSIPDETIKNLRTARAPKDAETYVVMPEFVNCALPDDLVEFTPTNTPKGLTGPLSWASEMPHAQVTKILERARATLVGRTIAFDDTNSKTIVFEADDRRMYTLFVIKNLSKEIVESMKVVVSLDPWTNPSSRPTCSIVQVLGVQGDHEAEMESIIYATEVSQSFPESVTQEAEDRAREGRTMTDEERASRRDMRDALTFTIDPADAKDFDDAISFRDLGNGRYEVGIHIADVSHFVQPGTALDREAFRRSTSIYLVDRVLPMLPESLSNDICSLNPHEDRRAFAVVLEIDAQGNVHNRWFGKTIINSNQRFSYEQAQDVIKTKTGPCAKELEILQTIAQALQKQKTQEGAIDFDTEEIKFELDGRGKPVRIIKKIRFEAHRLIEDFMLLANREVAKMIAEYVDKHGGSGLYRTHEAPDKDRLTDLFMLYKALGFDLDINQAIKSPKTIQAALSRITGSPAEALLKTATIRSMAKALYHTENTGHYGLAFSYYTHFTSPIRRYPDLIVHRLLEHILKGNEKSLYTEAQLRDIADHALEREIVAAEAERASIKFKQVEYMSQFIGQEFDGIISGVTEWGMFIEEKETKSEGMMRLKDLKDDFYVVEEKLFRVVGKNKKKTYSLGDSVRFRVVAANLAERSLDYVLVQDLK